MIETLPAGPWSLPGSAARDDTSIVIELSMPTWSPERESDAMSVLALAAEPVRWRVLQSLAGAGTQCVCELEPIAGVAPNVLSYHLKALREAGLVTSARRGRWIDYTLAPDAAERLERALPTSLPGSR